MGINDSEQQLCVEQNFSISLASARPSSLAQQKVLS